MPAKNKEKQLQQIAAALQDTALPLFSYRTKNKFLPVLGEGSLDANIMIIGEAPGKAEALSGKPFCGASGKLLSELLSSIGLTREEVYITNLVKDRPPENRDPSKKEIAAYAPLLIEQINIIQPKVIALLGRFSTAFVMSYFDLRDKIEPISEIHGKVLVADAPWGKVSLVPLYHPAYALYNGSKRPVLMADFKVLKRFY